MADEVSYFEVTSYLAEIEHEFAQITDQVQRTAGLVQRLQEKWPGLSGEQAVAYIRLFAGTD